MVWTALSTALLSLAALELMEVISLTTARDSASSASVWRLPLLAESRRERASFSLSGKSVGTAVGEDRLLNNLLPLPLLLLVSTLCLPVLALVALDCILGLSLGLGLGTLL